MLQGLMRKLMIGMVAGAIIGVLLAPKRGREIREDIMEQSEKVRSRAPEMTQTLREQGEKVRSGLPGLVSSTRERVGSMASMAREMRERTSSGDDEVADRISDALKRHTASMHRRDGAEESEGERRRGPSNKGLLVGGMMGAIAGILMAPKPGDETRRNLMQQTRVLKDRSDRLASNVREKAGPQMERARERASSMAESARERMG